RGGDIRRSKIKAALFSYIENALKYGREHDVSVVISRDERRVLFTVQSIGPQLDPSEYDLIFSLNYRGSNVGGVGGSGIGLYQVKRIAQDLDGDAYYEPVGESGNNFVFWVPAFPREG